MKRGLKGEFMVSHLETAFLYIYVKTGFLQPICIIEITEVDGEVGLRSF